MQSANQPMSALDNLRTVEFRQTLRGYHIDDVDEYLERVAVEAEALQEQLRQSAERMRQATERIVQLEQQQQQPKAAAPAPTEKPSGATEDTLQRTLLLAQKFVDQTHAEAEAQARAIVDEAQSRGRAVVSEAEERAKKIIEESEQRLREDVARLEALRGKLASDVETIGRYLEGERSRLRGALAEMLQWVDDNVQPAANLPGRSTDAPRGEVSRPTTPAPTAAPAAAAAEPDMARGLMALGQNTAPNGVG
ncbi:MAG TPA: DivIVA domain-containing protein [Acidimicrobiales bacterium]|nr:DivIVA domain-containing protein [Acidimicrobiales bacterium]